MLILTKPLGTGIINTVLKAGMAPDEMVNKSIQCMAELNRTAADIMMRFNSVHACTDVTGFGLLGHASEMIDGSDVGIIIQSSAVPVFAEIQPFVEMGIIPGGLNRNRNFRLHMVETGPDCPPWLIDVFFDPQTSGGLLIALPEKAAVELEQQLHDAGIEAAAIVGEVVAKPTGRIIVR